MRGANTGEKRSALVITEQMSMCYRFIWRQTWRATFEDHAESSASLFAVNIALASFTGISFTPGIARRQEIKRTRCCYWGRCASDGDYEGALNEEAGRIYSSVCVKRSHTAFYTVTKRWSLAFNTSQNYTNVWFYPWMKEITKVTHYMHYLGHPGLILQLKNTRKAYKESITLSL